MEIVYNPPGLTARAFMLSNTFVRGMRGPIGSGKSVTCIVELFRRCCEQAPGRDGKRRTRWAVIRNTYAELENTTMKTWCDWFPEATFGKIKRNPPPFKQTLIYNDVEAEILFIALDRPEDVKKLLSLELTGAFVNEAREVPKEIIDAITSRLRRYPSMKDGGPTWSGLIMDTNSPDEEHWWSIMAGLAPPPEWMTAEEQLMLVRPRNWEFFDQPPAMIEQKDKDGEVIGYEINPDAENLENLHDAYYTELVTGKSKHWIDVYVMNRIGSDFDGKKVQPHFSRAIHVSDEHIPPTDYVPLIGGVDFGLTPACIFEQFVMGQWRILYEIVLENASTEELAAQINMTMSTRFDGFKLSIWGDPAGDQRKDTDKNTPFQVLRAAGLNANPTATNDPEIRRASMANPLQRMVHGRPGLIISGPDCPILVRGLDGGWHYRRIGNRYTDEPDKNRYSHPCEAAEYGMQGGGEGRRALGRDPEGGKVGNSRGKWDRFARMKGKKSGIGRRFG